MPNPLTSIINNVKIMYPNGRAWWLPSGGDVPYIKEDASGDYITEDGASSYITEYGTNGIFLGLHEALGATEAQAYEDALSFLDALLPDNDNFTMDDAIAWYRRLGLYNSGNVSLADMKLAIAQKYYGRSANRYRQNYLYIQDQLQAAGFNVYVYENRFDNGSGGYMTKTVSDILSATYPKAYYGFTRYGQVGYGYVGVPTITKCVNYIEESKDATFNIGSNWRSTFFVASDPITTFADVPESRKNEFRQLLISLKPAQTVGFLFINYI